MDFTKGRIPLSVYLLSGMILVGCSDGRKTEVKGDVLETKSAKVAPDNTAKNERDVKGGPLTPEQQGGTEQDRSLTAEVRKLIVADETISTNGKNVKVITVNGVVTLRGPVENSLEKEKIAAKAQQVAGISRVDNQLEPLK